MPDTFSSSPSFAVEETLIFIPGTGIGLTRVDWIGLTGTDRISGGSTDPIGFFWLSRLDTVLRGLTSLAAAIELVNPCVDISGLAGVIVLADGRDSTVLTGLMLLEDDDEPLGSQPSSIFWKHRKEKVKGKGVLLHTAADPWGITSREVYQEFQPSYDIVRSWCQGLFRPQVPCTPSLHCPITNSASTQSQQPVNRTQLIKSSWLLRVSSNAQATLERESPIQVLNELNDA